MNGELSKHENVLQEIVTLKRQVKQMRLKRKEDELTLHYEGLKRQKLAIKVEELRVKAIEAGYKNASEAEKDMERILKAKE